jgi:Xaa-Pro aminopeptidase
LGIDERSLSLSTFKTIRTYSSALQFRAVNDLVETLAVQKDRTEIDRIRKAVKTSDRVFSDILPLIKSGVQECDIAAEIVYRMRLQGAESESFEPVVASGVRSAMPHARASAKKIRNGEFVLIDFGSTYRGYHSDMTRTIHLGKPSVRERRLYRAVSDAREHAIEKITAGIPANEIDRIARKSLGNDRLAKYFIHPVGHGIGLQVHEAPILSSANPYALAAGNVITIEPGVYIPGECGIRIEDVVVVEKNGCRVMTTSPRQLIIL